MTQAVATILTLIVAIVAARYAAKQVREARRQVEEAQRSREQQEQQAHRASREQNEREQRLLEEQARPFVTVDFEPSAAWMNIINLGHREYRKDSRQECAANLHSATKEQRQ